jgi:hypothetical protein
MRMNRRHLLFNIIVALIFSETTSISPVLPPPRYRNHTLEQTIADRTNDSELTVAYARLKNEDMQIIAYYALQNNKVSKHSLILTFSMQDKVNERCFFLLYIYSHVVSSDLLNTLLCSHQFHFVFRREKKIW